MAATIATAENTFSASLTENTWVEILKPDSNRGYILFDDEDASNGLRIAFPKYGDPFTYNFASSDIAITPILSAPNTWASAKQGQIQIRFNLDNAPGGGTEEDLIAFGDTNANEVFRLGVDENLKITGDLIDGGTAQWAFTADNAISVGEFYNFKFIHNGTEPKIWLNGVSWPISFDTSTDKTKFMSDLGGVDNGHIGCNNYNSAGKANNWDGLIERVKILDKNPSGHESVDARLWRQVAYYPLNEGTGTTATDKFQHGDNGTITAGSGAWFGWTAALTAVTDGMLLRANTNFPAYNYGELGEVIERSVWIYAPESTPTTIQVTTARKTG